MAVQFSLKVWKIGKHKRHTSFCGSGVPHLKPGREDIFATAAGPPPRLTERGHHGPAAIFGRWGVALLYPNHAPHLAQQRYFPAPTHTTDVARRKFVLCSPPPPTISFSFKPKWCGPISPRTCVRPPSRPLSHDTQASERASTTRENPRLGAVPGRRTRRGVLRRRGIRVLRG